MPHMNLRTLTSIALIFVIVAAAAAASSASGARCDLNPRAIARGSL
jgi:hypothetical protein